MSELTDNEKKDNSTLPSVYIYIAYLEIAFHLPRYLTASSAAVGLCYWTKILEIIL